MSAAQNEEGPGKATAPSAPRPAFAKDFPRDPELDRLVALFELGNYAAVRTDAERLASTTKDGDVKKAARELLLRLKPDPLALYLVAIAAGLLVVLAGWYWTHPHDAAPPPPPPPAPAGS